MDPVDIRHDPLSLTVGLLQQDDGRHITCRAWCRWGDRKTRRSDSQGVVCLVSLSNNSKNRNKNNLSIFRFPSYDQVLPAGPEAGGEAVGIYLALWSLPFNSSCYIRGSSYKKAVLGIRPLLIGWKKGGCSPLLAAADGWFLVAGCRLLGADWLE